MEIKKTTDYLDLAKKINGIKSDYELAIKIDVSRQEISYLRKEDRKVSETVATKIAYLIGCEPIEIIASANYLYGLRKNKSFWLEVYKKTNEHSPTNKLFNLLEKSEQTLTD